MNDELSVEEFKALLNEQKPGKYGAKKSQISDTRNTHLPKP
jgi:hypothetical protein